MANALKTLFGDIASAIKEKTGDTATMKPTEFPAKIAAIPTGGGGSAAGAVTVTFCNYDGTELYSRQVFIGDDCPDPVAQGKMPTPTRESSVQYDFTHSGWSATEGGASDASVLKNITADKSVYSAYASTLRIYTARFYDGETLMKEEQVAYGSKATPPDTTKDNFAFTGWTPSNLTIYGDTDFYGAWVLDEGWLVKIDFPINIGNSNLSTRAIYSVDGAKLFMVCHKTLYMYDSTEHPYRLISTHTIGSYSNDIAVSPNGNLLAISCNRNSSYARDIVYLYYLSGDTLTRVNLDKNYTLEFSTYGQGVAFSADSKTLFLGDSSSYGKITAINTEINSSNLSEDRSCETVHFVSTNRNGKGYISCSPDGQKMAIGYNSMYTVSRGVYVCNFVDGNVVLEDRSNNVNEVVINPQCIAYSPDGRYLAVGGSKDSTNSDIYELVVYDTTTVPYTRVIAEHLNGTVYGVTFSRDGSLVAFATNISPYLEVYDVETWTRKDDPKEIPRGVCDSVSFNNDDTVLAVGSEHVDHLYLYDVRK